MSSSGYRATLLACLVIACLSSFGCDDSDPIVNTSGPFSLRFSMGADFQDPHGGQAIEWALFRSDNDERVAEGAGTMSATLNPAFTLQTGPVMLFGVPHELHYWIDSNVEGGTPGVCDAETVDLQWITQFAGAEADLNFIVVYRPDLVQPVCDSFTP